MLTIVAQNKVERIEDSDNYIIQPFKQKKDLFFVNAYGINEENYGDSIILGRYVTEEQTIKIIRDLMDMEFNARKFNARKIIYQMLDDFYDSSPKSCPVIETKNYINCWKCAKFVNVSNWCTQWCEEVTNPEMTCAYAERKY